MPELDLYCERLLAYSEDAVESKRTKRPGQHQRNEPGIDTSGLAENGCEEIKAKEVVELHSQVTGCHNQKAPGEQRHAFAECSSFQGTRGAEGEIEANQQEGEFKDTEPLLDRKTSVAAMGHALMLREAWVCNEQKNQGSKRDPE